MNIKVEIFKSVSPPPARDGVRWINAVTGVESEWTNSGWKVVGAGGLLPEDKEKVEALIIDGDGDKYLADDGTYKEIDIPDFPIDLVTSDNVSKLVILSQAAYDALETKDAATLYFITQ